MSNTPAYRCGNATTTNKNRRSKLKDRMNKLIDNSSLSYAEKEFLKPQLRSILKEFAELYEVRNKNN